MDVEACSTGRVTFLYTAVRTLLVLSSPFFADHMHFAGMLFALLLIMTALQILILPYYRIKTNQIRAGMFMTGTYFALMSMVLGTVFHHDPPVDLSHDLPQSSHSLASVPGLLPATNATNADIAASHSSASGDASLTLASAVGMVVAVPFFWLGARLSLVWYRAVQKKERDLKDYVRPNLRRASDTGSTYEDWENFKQTVWQLVTNRKRFFTAFEVELAARAALGPSLVATGFSKELAESMFKAGIRDYPWASYIRLHFILFLDSKKHAMTQAAGELSEAWAQNPPFDIRFALRAKQREWEHQTHSENLGSEVNYLNVLEYKNLMSEATESHNQTIILLRTFWRTLANPRVSVQQLLQVPKALEQIDRAKSVATRAYRALLAKFPQSKTLLRSYGTFLEVCNEQELAKIHFQAADEIEEAQEAERAEAEAGDGDGDYDDYDEKPGGGKGGVLKKTGYGTASAKGSQRGSAHGSSHSSASATRARLAQSTVVVTEIAAVRMLSRGIIFGMVVVACVSSTCYAVVAFLVKSFLQEIVRIDKSSGQMRWLMEFCFQLRSLNLFSNSDDQAGFDDWLDSVKEVLENFRASHLGLYLGFTDQECPSSGVIQTLYTQPTVAIDQYYFTNGKETVRHYLESMWNVGNYLMGQVDEIIHMDISQLKDLRNNEPFRYVMLNAPEGVLSVAATVTDKIQEEVFQETNNAQAILGGLLGASVFILIFLAVFVFRPAFRKVRQTMRGVSEMIIHMPLKVRKALHAHHMRIPLVTDKSEDDSGQGDDRDDDLADFEEVNNRDPNTNISNTNNNDNVVDMLKPPPVVSDIAVTEAATNENTPATFRISPPPLPVRIKSSSFTVKRNRRSSIAILLPRGSANLGGAKPISMLELSDIPDDDAQLLTDGMPSGGGDNDNNTVNKNAIPKWEGMMEKKSQQQSDRSAKGGDRYAPTNEKADDDPETIALVDSGRRSVPSASRASSVGGEVKPLRRGSLKQLAEERKRRNSAEGKSRRHRRRDSASSVGSEANSEANGKGPRRASLNDIRGRKDQNDIVAVLSKRYLIAFSLIALTSAANFVCVFMFLSSTQYSSAFINYGGKRSYHVTELHFYARELFINDGLVASKPVLAQRLERCIDNLRQVHSNLVSGNASAYILPGLIRYGPQDFLLFKEKCLHVDPSNCVEGEVQNMASVTSGLDFLLQTIMDRALVVLQDNEYYGIDGQRNFTSESIYMPPKPHYNYPELMNMSIGLRDILQMDESGNLDDAMTRSMQLYKEIATERVNMIISMEAGILAFQICFLIGLYMFLFRPLVKRLRTECNRTSQFIAMLPKEVLMQVDVLRKYLSSKEREEGAGDGNGT
eukprot:CAMPEP_0184676918 /NCGR_PEP_ID=MMETSP0308-20130426/88605_1 /TAXON_ID=38269 /ORGANISM="Gloeochaete witrockiana, Strain SAG 46.84" /LENGTH=1343 /DNA_ID=CAMNT_0027124781 /DNA_START=958 /DNA_END=4989 /DNA_ORIENTATION=-